MNDKDILEAMEDIETIALRSYSKSKKLSAAQFDIARRVGVGVPASTDLEIVAQTVPDMSISVKPGMIYMPYGKVLSFPSSTTIELPTADLNKEFTTLVCVMENGDIKCISGKLNRDPLAGQRKITITNNLAPGDIFTIEGESITAIGDYPIPEGSTLVGATIEDTALYLMQTISSNVNITALYNVSVDGDSIVLTERVPGGGNTPGVASITGTGTLINHPALASTIFPSLAPPISSDMYAIARIIVAPGMQKVEQTDIQDLRTTVTTINNLLAAIQALETRIAALE